LIQAILLFGTAPFHLLFLLGAAWAAATDPVSPFPARWVLAMAAAWLGALYAPKWLGFAEVLPRPAERRRYGGGIRVCAGLLAETVFTLLLDPILVTAKTAATLRLLTGRQPGWLPQNRSARGVTWAEAARLCWPQTLLGVAVFACFAQAGLGAMLWAAPFAGGLLLAIPFCVLTAAPGFGAWLRAYGVAAVPEEIS
jgi:membrane glycosyltransferase